MGTINITSEQITAWITKHFDHKSRKGGVEILIDNPFDGDTGSHFNINTVKGVCHDWRPGHQQYDGSFVKFVQAYKRISFFEALRDICGHEADLRSILRPTKVEELKEDISESTVGLPKGIISFRDTSDTTIKHVAANYLKSRGISLDIAEKHNIHYGGDRIYFPYYEYGIQVYWQARTIIGKTFEFPETDSSGQGKSKYLYGFDNAEPTQPLYITESIFNTLSIGDGAVATGGASMSIQQCKKIRAIGPNIVILSPDRDQVGIMSIIQNIELIRSIIDVECRFVIPPHPYKDWNDMWKENPKNYIDKYSQPTTPVHINKALQSL